MAVYVTSDLHGYPHDRFLSLLEKAGFSGGDWLYILGDVIDRNGDGGIETLTWLLTSPNAQLLLGNHEAMLLSCCFLFNEVTDDTLDSLTIESMKLLQNWMANGAEPTMRSLRRLMRKSPETLADILEYLGEAPLYETVEVGGRAFVLCHAGLGGFSSEKRLRDYTPEELLWHRPHPDERYFEKATTVIGHTPTGYYGSRGRAFHTDTWIDVDTGAADGKPPMLLCLDTMQEFYLQEE